MKILLQTEKYKANSFCNYLAHITFFLILYLEQSNNKFNG